jgi:rare lipoprotein A
MGHEDSSARRWRLFLIATVLTGLAGCANPFFEPQPDAAPREPVTSEGLSAPAKPATPAQHGIATYYAKKFTNRTMADGTPFDPKSDSAASNTLPLGSKAEVTNLHNGRKAVVTIRDRGPHAHGAIIDVSPKTAEKLGMVHKGKANVRVKPLGGATKEAQKAGGEQKEAQKEP